MTGITEILLLVLLTACIFILPRMLNRESAAQKKAESAVLKGLSTKTRGFVVISIVYPLCMVFFLNPWQGNLFGFVFFGFFPVFLFWAIIWILAGRKK